MTIIVVTLKINKKKYFKGVIKEQKSKFIKKGGTYQKLTYE
jgi:hypothetical protein